MLLTLKTQKSHTPSITIVIITVYLKENGNKKMKLLIRNYLQQKEEAPSKLGLGL